MLLFNAGIDCKAFTLGNGHFSAETLSISPKNLSRS